MQTKFSDVTIVGAGVAGICAAIAAARNGLTVSLVHDRPIPGGNASSEIGVPILGSAAQNASPSVYAREGGIVEEIKLMLKHNKGYYLNGAMLDATFLELLNNEKNINLYLNTHVVDVIVKENKIEKLSAVQINNEGRYEFVSPIFIDSSGDGFVGFTAGAEFRQGREACDEFHESEAPQAADSYVLGDTLLWSTRNVGKPVSYKAPSFAYDITKMLFFEGIKDKRKLRFYHRDADGNFNGIWWVEYGGQVDPIKDNEEIVWELRKLVYGFWDYIKNSGEFENVENLELYKVCPIPGKRESRRFVGDYMLTQNDIVEKKQFHDVIATGGWTIDVHAPKGIYDDEPSTNWCFVPGLYQIPFRCIYSKNIDNLMFAGRNISASHIALGSTRIIGTCACLGQAAGTAAVLCKRNGILPRDVYQQYIEQLQNMLHYGDQLLTNLRDKSNDEFLDVVEVSASSQKEVENTKADVLLALEKHYCLAIPLDTDKLDSLEVMVKNENDFATQIEVEFYKGQYIDTYLPNELIKTIRINVPALFNGFLPVDIQLENFKDYKCYICFKKTSGIHFYCSEEQLTGVVCFEMNPENVLDEFRKGPLVRLTRIPQGICFRNVLPRQNLYNPKHLLDGYTRPYGTPRMWISDGINQEFVNLQFTKPCILDELHLFFNTEPEYDVPKELIHKLITSYEVVVEYENKTEKIAVSDNIFRFRKHKLQHQFIKNIKIHFLKNNGSSNMELFAIKLIGEKHS